MKSKIVGPQIKWINPVSIDFNPWAQDPERLYEILLSFWKNIFLRID
ncbi:hypothetical protein LEP1GSC051_0110 [Leptospira sp. P2653]|uniref:Uncharacterized protein n=1 Tax=Leptospira weilii str. UI 13098 TaxID=1088542 RepID=M6Q9Y5_9LEPT|nr:hypothetical protein LEP1GSC051_0110 [Leptospira sp. P2653]EMN89428.1 hypothetical protein LEP1GSC108_0401 [Leptospira weilii str. UI 13098]